MRISEQFTGSLKSFAGAGKPLDPLIERLESDMTVTYFMLPIPGSSTDKEDDAIDLVTTWDPASREALALESIFAQFLDVTRLTHIQSISDFLMNPLVSQALLWSSCLLFASPLPYQPLVI